MKIYKMIDFIKCELVTQYLKVKFLFYKERFRKLKIASIEDTIEKITAEKLSVSRFGDGEFKWIVGAKQNSFQSDCLELANRLREVLQSGSSVHGGGAKKRNHIVCLPAACNSMGKGVLTAKTEKVFQVALAECSPKIWETLSENTQYYATDFTRFYIPYRDKTLAKKRFELLRERLIAGKKLLIVEGEYTRNGVGNDLLNSAKRIRRIVCPARDAFGCYNEILTSVIEFCEPDELVLLSLGPTATVLAYDLSKMGIWAIDFGHMDIEYEWCIREAEQKISIPGKHVNEVTGNRIIGTISEDNLKEYETQIISRVGI